MYHTPWLGNRLNLGFFHFENKLGAVCEKNERMNPQINTSLIQIYSIFTKYTLYLLNILYNYWICYSIIIYSTCQNPQVISRELRHLWGITVCIVFTSSMSISSRAVMIRPESQSP